VRSAEGSPEAYQPRGCSAGICREAELAPYETQLGEEQPGQVLHGIEAHQGVRLDVHARLRIDGQGEVQSFHEHRLHLPDRLEASAKLGMNGRPAHRRRLAQRVTRGLAGFRGSLRKARV